MKLYWAPRTRSLRALWVLEEAGVPYERVRLDLAAGEQKSPDYRAINPMAKVPALTDGPVAVAESGAICAYVAEAVPQAGLAPPVGDPARGRYLQWLFFSPGCIEPAYSHEVRQYSGAARRWRALVISTGFSTCSRKPFAKAPGCLASSSRRPMS